MTTTAQFLAIEIDTEMNDIRKPILNFKCIPKD